MIQYILGGIFAVVSIATFVAFATSPFWFRTDKNAGVQTGYNTGKEESK